MADLKDRGLCYLGADQADMLNHSGDIIANPLWLSTLVIYRVGPHLRQRSRPLATITLRGAG
jgi:hypothetical protein